MWLSLIVLADAARAELLSDALMDHGALTVSIEDADAGTDAERPQFGEPGTEPAALWDHSRLVALFDPGEDPAAALAGAARQAGYDRPPAFHVDTVAEQDWIRLSQDQFEPIHVGERLWIVPSWHQPPQPDAVNIRLDPGMAFGTGSHPTTRLCLQWLQREVGTDTAVLDYGCGSGILAIAAACLGARRVVGIDIDPKAIDAARANAEANGVAITLRQADQPLAGEFDIVVANILTNPLCALAPAISSSVASGGRLALAGILDSQSQRVIEAYAPWIALSVGDARDGWVRLEGRRR
ncbi:MAG: 50S ribosomal protein L11 methyltransferase [Rhodocyclaceae bacterium]|nr:50S ribosomal protein L11 methyltransferase [Rhodocyclaceae bacterium]